VRKYLLFIVFSLIYSISFNQNIDKIRVVCDDNYPPFCFRDENGNVKGVLPDLWSLWEKKTKIKVDFFATDWDKAISLFESGNFDILETAFYTENRAKKWAYSKPYANIEVPVFHNKSLSGIVDIKSLKGFEIGVKKGDACVEIFKRNGIESLVEFLNYESIINAADSGLIKVFCVDYPPAFYYLNKANIENNFRLAFNLYSGQFHRVSLKSNQNLIKIVESGFEKISDKEKQNIYDFWLGKPLLKPINKKQLIWTIIVVFIIIISLLIFNIILQRKVKEKTNSLNNLLFEISEKEKWFRNIYNSVIDTIFIHDYYTGEIIDINNSGEKLLGYDKNEIKNLNIGELSSNVPPYTNEEALKRIRNSKNESYQRFEWLSKRKDGKLVWVDIILKYCIYNKRELVLVVARDITERKMVEAELLDLNQNLEKKVEERTKELTFANKELESFAYTVSHDLRAPLRAIDGYIGILMEDFYPQLNEDARRVCNIISKNARMMGQLIDDLLSFSRINRYEMKLSFVNFNEIISEILQDYADSNKLNNAVIEVSELPLTNCDRTLIKQVWYNLIDNAIKFSSKKEKQIIKVKSIQNDAFTVFSIEDNGTGIDLKYANKLFGVFNRLHTQNEYEGTGVGLAIVQRIIHRHRGEIWVESELGEGSTFFFSIPKIYNNSFAL
jgi:PAS domain S-box-containing protein